MSTTTTAPGKISPRTLAALLAREYFQRSDYHRPDVHYNAASTGFRVWRTSSRSAPEAEALAVAHYDAGQHDLSADGARDAWNAHVRSARHMLGLYAVVIEGAGYRAEARFAADDPYLVVTAGAPEDREGQ
jgi:hypothetical protein